MLRSLLALAAPSRASVPVRAHLPCLSRNDCGVTVP